MDAWTLRRAEKLLSGLPIEEKFKILEAGAGLCGKLNKVEHLKRGYSTESRTVQVRTPIKKRENNNLSTQRASTGRRAYICTRWPYLQIGKRVKFENGYFATEDMEIQALIEAKPEYGALIKPTENRREVSEGK